MTRWRPQVQHLQDSGTGVWQCEQCEQCWAPLCVPCPLLHSTLGSTALWVAAAGRSGLWARAASLFWPQRSHRWHRWQPWHLGNPQSRLPAPPSFGAKAQIPVRSSPSDPQFHRSPTPLWTATPARIARAARSAQPALSRRACQSALILHDACPRRRASGAPCKRLNPSGVALNVSTSEARRKRNLRFGWRMMGREGKMGVGGCGQGTQEWHTAK